jgi:NAD(P)-dependent dehydrogenase (short-subunit alcohol dehydrogenase family)
LTYRYRTSSGDLARSLGIELDHLVAGLPQQMGLSIGRLAEPEETAATIAFLASPLAGAITGTDILVDGGAVKTV